MATAIRDVPGMSNPVGNRVPNAVSGEEREREILGGQTLAERVRLEGGGFWLRLTETQTSALKKHLRDVSSRDGRPRPPTDHVDAR